MSHEIMQHDRFGEVRVNGRRAWHGLGDEIEAGLTATEGFVKLGLDTESELQPLYTKVPFIDEDGVKHPDQLVEMPVLEKVVHVREDNVILGVVGADYKQFPNRNMAQFADCLAGLDKAVQIETAGSLRNGRRVFALIRLPGDIEVTQDDIVRKYVALTNTHDGSGAFRCYYTDVRIVCANTWAASMRDADRGIRFQHTGDIEQKIEQARMALGILTKTADKRERLVHELAKVRWDAQQQAAYFEQVFAATYGKIELLDDGSNAKAVEKKNMLIEVWQKNMHDKRQDMPGISGTAWAAYNAVSQWHDHERGRFKGVAESDGRVHSNLFGASAKDKSIAWNKAVAMATA